MPKLIIPIVHMNGTSADELLQLREDFYAALMEAEKKLGQMAPNARDYYPDPDRMDKALAQHRRRLDVFAVLLKEIEDECQEIELQRYV